MARKEKSALKHYGKALIYPCGIMDLCACTKPVFHDSGWEAAEDYAHPKRGRMRTTERIEGDAVSEETQKENIERSMRRARAKVRRIALANDFRYFVTLTINPDKVDSCNTSAVVKKLNAWASNMVQRYGLKYILVPERHKKGGIHFHGFFNDVLPVVDSGTLRLPWAKKPRKPRSAKQREEWFNGGASVVYNIPGWNLGFTTALLLTGEYPAAVSYVAKYIGKDGEKIGGRWYYSGGDLKAPLVQYLEISPAELLADYGNRAMVIYPPGMQIAIVNGIKCTCPSTEEGGIL